MVYDPDQAGELATLRSLDIFVDEEMQVKVATLPHGQDPDLFVRTQGLERFKEIIAQASGLFDYKLKVLKSRFKIQEIEGKAKISQQMLETISRFKNAVLRSEYLKKLAQELNVREDALLEEVRKIKPEKPYADIHPAALKKDSAFCPTEKLLIKLMCEENTLIMRIREHLEPGDFQDTRTSKVVSLIFELMEQGRQVDPHMLVNLCGDEDISGLICESVFLPEGASIEQKERMVDDCIQRLKAQRLRKKKLSLHDQIRNAQDLGDEQGVTKLIEEFHGLLKTKPELTKQK
jgi:DNA primase